MFVKKKIVDFLSFSPHKLFNEQKQLANSRAPFFFLVAKNELCRRRFIEFYFEYDIVDCRLCLSNKKVYKTTLCLDPRVFVCNAHKQTIYLFIATAVVTHLTEKRVYLVERKKSGPFLF